MAMCGWIDFHALPRICGGASAYASSSLTCACSSPHTRGCSEGAALRGTRDSFFPAYAGVFLGPATSGNDRCSSSPHTRGCPGLGLELMVRVRPLPRIRGGVPALNPETGRPALSCPHTRGCSCRSARDCLSVLLFPACAGVFLNRAVAGASQRSLPRIRGGVPNCERTTNIFGYSSPRARGCFRDAEEIAHAFVLFPAGVGVFLCMSR